MVGRRYRRQSRSGPNPGRGATNVSATALAVTAAVKEDTARVWRRRRRRLRRRVRRAAEVIALLGFVVVIGIALFKTDKSSAPPPTTTTVPLPPARADVRMTSCHFADNAATSGLTITNHTDQKFNYSVHVVFVDGKKLFGLGIATTDNLPGRRVAHITAVTLRSVSPKHLGCFITVINRFP